MSPELAQVLLQLASALSLLVAGLAIRERDLGLLAIALFGIFATVAAAFVLFEFLGI